MARKAPTISDVLAEVDSLIAAEEDEHLHPLYYLVAHVLGETTQPGSAEGLMERWRRLIDHAIERLVEAGRKRPVLVPVAGDGHG
jgi:hypothetical protein